MRLDAPPISGGKILSRMGIPVAHGRACRSLDKVEQTGSGASGRSRVDSGLQRPESGLPRATEQGRQGSQVLAPFIFGASPAQAQRAGRGPWTDAKCDSDLEALSSQAFAFPLQHLVDERRREAVLHRPGGYRDPLLGEPSPGFASAVSFCSN